MNPALRKEIRLLLPAWIVALAAATLPVWTMGRGLLMSEPELMEGTSLVLFVTGALLLSLSSFGSEMSFGTFPSLLAQPRPRLATWRMKIGLLALGLAVVTLAEGFSWWMRIHALKEMHMQDADRGLPDFYAWFVVRVPHPYQMFYLLVPIAVIAFASGLWTSLLLRQMLTAFWIAIIAPLVLFWPWVHRQWGNESFAPASCIYGLAGYFLARRLFLNAQDTQTNAVVSAAKWTLLPAFRRSRWPVAALVSKELRLQQGIMLFACALVLVDLATLAALKYCGHLDSLLDVIGASFLGWGCVPLLAGCLSIAEERQSHTLEGALCLPIGRRTQFLIKLAVVFGLGIFLGAVLPWLLAQLRPVAQLDELATVSALQKYMVVAAVITAVGCFASSLCGTLLQAFGAAIALFTLSAFAGSAFDLLSFALQPLCMLVGRMKLIHVMIVVRSFLDRVFGALPNTPESVRIAAVIAFPIALLAYMSYGNFKQLRIDWRKWCRIGLIVSVAYAFLLVLGFVSMVILRHRTHLH